MTTDEVTRRLTTILAADVVGYSRLMAEDEERTLRTFRRYREIIDGLINKHSGRIFNTAGDAVLAEFDSAVECVRCAISIQEELRTRNSELPENRRIELRIGINVGDVMVEKGDLFGDGVNVAARLEGLAKPGGVCISASTFEQVKNKLSVGFEDMGPQNVKNIPGPVGAFQVVSGTVTLSAGAPSKPRSRKSAGLIIGTSSVLLLVLVSAGFYLFYGSPERWSVDTTASLPDNVSTQELKADDVRSFASGIVINGITQYDTLPFTLNLLEGGTAELTVLKSDKTDEVARRETGKWWAENYQFCFQFSRFASGQARCPTLTRENGKYLAARGNNEPLPWEVKKPVAND